MFSSVALAESAQSQEGHWFPHRHILGTSPISAPVELNWSNFATYDANYPIEDRHFVAKMTGGHIFASVFDGHGGWQAAEYAQRHLEEYLEAELAHCATHPGQPLCDSQVQGALSRAFERVERGFITLIHQSFNAGFGAVARVGTCALVALVRGERIFIANAGDCRAVLGRRQHKNGRIPGITHVPVALSSDHNCREPKEQLKLRKWHPAEDNVFVCKRPDSCYVKGCLQPTRSIGDAYLKYPEFNGPPGQPAGVERHKSRGRHIPPPYTPPYITARPEVTCHMRRTAEDDFLILASDGLWDYLDNQEAVAIVAQGIAEGDEDLGQRLVSAVLQEAAKAQGMTVDQLRKVPVGRQRRRLHDDITVVVIRLDKEAQQRAAPIQ
eukprot:CAMPEP_0113943046 /NCGR_PEP_ID=MMETSP1339-20121228/17997_1 /TAXON_ID=94617 /ORGANISM="Fibrocapsa japonica" /LENGTH=381 /DNA_ID=CAMNT_0000947791 /DNA_START=390 /DNA_END=1535 /DNA_ORIENTATION=+ /assembly_acc=CAM_ASM_000762